MAFWIVAALMLAAVAGVLSLSAWRAHAGLSHRAAELKALKARMHQIEDERTRNLFDDDEAARLKRILARRILALDAQILNHQGDIDRAGGARRQERVVMTVTLLAGVAASFGIYAGLGSPGYQDMPIAKRHAEALEVRNARPGQEEAEAEFASLSPPMNVEPESAELVARLREVLATRQDDVAGHVLLSKAEAKLGNFSGAHRALGQAIEIMGQDAPASLMSSRVEMMVRAAGGMVTPEAEAVARTALALAPRQAAPRFYLGLMHGQTGRPDLAFRWWSQLLDEGSASHPWTAFMAERIEGLAVLAGSPLYSPPPLAVAAAAAEDDALSPVVSQPGGADVTEMAAGMVDSLKARLEAEGGNPAEWAHLVRSLLVLGDNDEAARVLNGARNIFQDDLGALSLLNRAAASGAVPVLSGAAEP